MTNGSCAASAEEATTAVGLTSDADDEAPLFIPDRMMDLTLIGSFLSNAHRLLLGGRCTSSAGVVMSRHAYHLLYRAEAW